MGGAEHGFGSIVRDGGDELRMGVAGILANETGNFLGAIDSFVR